MLCTSDMHMHLYVHRWLYSSSVYLAKKETAESSDDESYEMPKAVGSHESPSFLHDPLAM